MKVICSWSGGKDSSYALWKCMQQGYEPAVLFNVMNETGLRSRSHGLSEAVLREQANHIGLPIQLVASSWENYETNFIASLRQMKVAYSTEGVVFGDIDIQQHREWEEMVSVKADLVTLLPLWQQHRKALVYEMLDAGFEAMIVSCNDVLGESFLGKILDLNIVAELEKKGVDVCGENGEYHTLLVNAPFFKERLKVNRGAIASNNGYWFLEVNI